MAASAPSTSSESIARVNSGRSSPRFWSPDDSRPMPPIAPSRGALDRVETLPPATARHCLVSVPSRFAHQGTRRRAAFWNGTPPRNAVARSSRTTRHALEGNVSTEAPYLHPHRTKSRPSSGAATPTRVATLPIRVRAHRRDRIPSPSPTPTTTNEASRMPRRRPPRGPPPSPP